MEQPFHPGPPTGSAEQPDEEDEVGKVSNPAEGGRQEDDIAGRSIF